MDQLPFDNFEQLAQCLQNTYTGATMNPNQASNIIITMAKEPVRFTNSMLTLVIAELEINGSYVTLFSPNSAQKRQQG